MLKINHINAGYGDAQILWDLSMDIEKGKITALVGANGVGKTTLLRIISGALSPYDGQIIYEGKDITSLPQAGKVRRGIVMVPEGRQLYQGMTVEDNLLMGAYTRNDAARIKKDLEWIFSAFPILRSRRKQLCGTLSGGEAQMCAIGRGLMSGPEILLIDELSLGLAPVVVDLLISLLKEIQSSRGVTILLVDQDVQTALSIAEFGYVIVHGHVEMSGKADEILNDPAIQKAYLGL